MPAVCPVMPIPVPTAVVGVATVPAMVMVGAVAAVCTAGGMTAVPARVLAAVSAMTAGVIALALVVGVGGIVCARLRRDVREAAFGVCRQRQQRAEQHGDGERSNHGAFSGCDA